MSWRERGRGIVLTTCLMSGKEREGTVGNVGGNYVLTFPVARLVFSFGWVGMRRRGDDTNYRGFCLSGSLEFSCGYICLHVLLAVQFFSVGKPSDRQRQLV